MAFLIAILLLLGILYVLRRLLPCTTTACLLILILFAYEALAYGAPMGDAGITLCAIALVAAFVADFVRPFLWLFRSSDGR